MESSPVPPTRLLHLEDPDRLDGAARVLAHGVREGRPTLILDSTVFYPEGGGQLADQGTIGEIRITDVQKDASGVVHHVTEAQAALPEPGAEVAMSVDRGRRRLHGALHTGQHILSRAFEDVARAPTVAARLFGSACSIDLGTGQLDEAAVSEALSLANAVVEENRPVRARFPEASELARLPLRKEPAVVGPVRVVEVEGFDLTPCGGTHCRSTAEVGFLTILGLDRRKGTMHVEFLAGRAALAELEARSRDLVELGRLFTTGPRLVRAGVEKLRRELEAARAEKGRFRSAWLDREVERLIRSGPGSPLLAVEVPGADLALGRDLALRLAALAEGLVGVGAQEPEGWTLVLARGPASTIDCGALLRGLAGRTGGRGGGRPALAEGRLPAALTWAAIEEAIRAALSGT